MKMFLFIPFLIVSKISFGQQKQCSCSLDTLIGQNIDCKTTFLTNGAILYWQFSCDSIWLTLQTKSGKKVVIDKVPMEYYDYIYRLGYQLMKEYRTSLLFKYGCPANGPCRFVLIDKNSGNKIKQFGELVYNHDHKKFYSFLIYLSSKNRLSLYYVNDHKQYDIPIQGKYLNAIVPSYQFNDIHLKDNILTLHYTYVKGNVHLRKKMLINLKTKAIIKQEKIFKPKSNKLSYKLNIEL